MQTKMKLILTTISAALLFSACSTTQAQETSKKMVTEQELKLQAKKAIQTVGGAFMQTLNAKVKEGGLTNAANFCSTHTKDLYNKVSKSLDEGVSVRRVTDKPRNQQNMASKEQLVVLEEIKTKLAIKEKVDMIVKQKSSNHYQVYKPIVMAGKCLNCHGDNKTRNKEAYEIISKKYPSDKAINYKAGEFRGAFLVDIIK